MAKYYVQSGSYQEVVQAEDAQGAALWLIHRALEEVVPISELDWLSEDQQQDLEFSDGLLLLDDEIQVSELGFGREEAGVFETAETMAHLNELILALSKLHQAHLPGELSETTEAYLRGPRKPR